MESAAEGRDWYKYRHKFGHRPFSQTVGFGLFNDVLSTAQIIQAWMKWSFIYGLFKNAVSRLDYGESTVQWLMMETLENMWTGAAVAQSGARFQYLRARIYETHEHFRISHASSRDTNPRISRLLPTWSWCSQLRWRWSVVGWHGYKLNPWWPVLSNNFAFARTAWWKTRKVKLKEKAISVTGLGVQFVPHRKHTPSP
jgi:hypothetical protein